MSEVRKISHIFVIQSLPNDDRPTGKELYDDVIRRHIDFLQPESLKMTHAFFDPQDKTAFIEILKYIKTNSSYLAGGLLIHFEIHGNSNQDGLVFADQSFMSWTELVELLRPINVETSNNLFITLATCYGRYLYQGVDPFEKSPYQAYISASKEIKTFEVLENFNNLFEILIESGDLIYAYTEHEKNNSPFFYKDSLTTFNETIQTFLNNLSSDPEQRNRIIDHPVIQEQIRNRQVDQTTLDSIIKAAFNEIIRRQAEAFNFSD